VIDDKKTKFRTLWISDIHLGTRGCQANYLLDFLKSIESDTLYLVGDIVDGWHLKKGWYWPQTHNDVVQKYYARGARVLGSFLFLATMTKAFVNLSASTLVKSKSEQMPSTH
jgi:UDP-2,3-diacylglucosamine pyrophosphatase LpxH